MSARVSLDAIAPVEWYQCTRADGIPPRWGCAPRPAFYAALFEDPDGNKLEVVNR